jgi:signal peptidase I
MSETPKRPYRELLEAAVIALMFLRFANTFVVQTFYIPSESMVDTLLVGDHLFVNRFIYGPGLLDAADGVLPRRDIERGDIVVFRSPQEPEMDLVKRCVGLPGDEIQVVSKQLYINGQAVDDEGYTQHVGYHPLAVNYGPVTVPEDSFFCMGDNREQSMDSRFWGPVPGELVKGRAVMIYWSYGGETPDGRWHGWGEKLGQVGKTLVGFPTMTRWDRTFLVIR